MLPIEILLPSFAGMRGPTALNAQEMSKEVADRIAICLLAEEIYEELEKKLPRDKRKKLNYAEREELKNVLRHAIKVPGGADQDEHRGLEEP